MVEIFWAAAAIIIALPLYFFVLYVRVVRAEKKSYLDIKSLKPELKTIVVIMGAEAYLEGPSPELKARLSTALQIYDLVSPQKIYVYGGQGDVNEAESMKNYLSAAGLPEKIIHADSNGQNTRASLERFSTSHTPSEIDQLIGVSSGYHSFRLVSQAKKLGFKIIPISPQYSPENQNRAVRRLRLISEVFAILWYKIPRSLSNRVDTGPDSFRHRIPNYFISRIRRKTSEGQNLGSAK